MARNSFARNTFNGGEFSVLVEARTDLDRYAASARVIKNFLLTPQGPLLARSGTQFVAAVYDEARKSALVPFVFNETQAMNLEFGHQRMRIVDEAGVQVVASANPTSITQANPLRFNVNNVTLGAAVGSQLFLSGFPASAGLNGRVLDVTAQNTGSVTLNYAHTGTAFTTGTLSRVFHIATPYSETDVHKIRSVQSYDVMYLFCEGYRPQKLTRFSATNWTLEELVLADGPFMPVDDSGTRLTPGGTGNPVPNMNSATSPSGVASASSNEAGRQPYLAFDNDYDTYWSSDIKQIGWLSYQFPNPTVINGYVLYPALKINDDANRMMDFAPATWTFEASDDGVTWIVLDRQNEYLLWDNRRTVYFKVNNNVAYTRYRINIRETQSQINGNRPAIGRFAMSTPSPDGFTLTASAVTGINHNEGFKSTDVGRLIRLKQNDANWRTVRITGYTSPTVVTVRTTGEPLMNTEPVLQWRLGYWSDTTGWPTCGTFFEDRLWLGGSFDHPDIVAGSRTGAYTDFKQTSDAGEVLDDSAIVYQLRGKRLSRVRWLATDERGLIAGTGSQEFVIQAAGNDDALTARNPRARSSTQRGSADMEPVQIDRQVLFVQANGRTVRELAYVFEADGYRAPSMSLFASHLGASEFKEVDYAAEPHSILWFRREDGTLVGLTYNREENVIGWHRHDIGGGGIVESVSVLPSPTYKQDLVWLVVRRTIAGNTRRFIERLMPAWTFTDTLSTAHFLDAATRYQGAETKTVSGLWHLEGATVEALADGRHETGLVVTSGTITLRNKAANVLIGYEYESFVEPSRPRVDTQSGAGFAKAKRPHTTSLLLWSSAYGEIGRYNEDSKEYEWRPIEYDNTGDELSEPALSTELTDEIPMPVGYGKDGIVSVRRTKPYPLNIIGMYPNMATSDA